MFLVWLPEGNLKNQFLGYIKIILSKILDKAPETNYELLPSF